jgi:hypothetical protein
MLWRILTYRLPSNPSRHRVAVWRELRRLGAVALQQGTWAVPSGEEFEEGLHRVLASIEGAGGEPLVVTVADDDLSVGTLEDRYTAEREAEWTEFLADCGKYEAELAEEVAKGKLTLAELDEEEESLDRLRRWYRTIRGRDLFGAPSGTRAEMRLKECVEALERFAEQVYDARDQL